VVKSLPCWRKVPARAAPAVKAFVLSVPFQAASAAASDPSSSKYVDIADEYARAVTVHNSAVETMKRTGAIIPTVLRKLALSQNAEETRPDMLRCRTSGYPPTALEPAEHISTSKQRFTHNS
jgi:hypothetical protein